MRQPHRHHARLNAAFNQGFAIAPILYLLGLIGVGAGVLFSGYSQILRSNQTMANIMSSKNDLQGTATTLAASSWLSTDQTLLCPPMVGSHSPSTPAVKCSSASGAITVGTSFASAVAANLPANYASVSSAGSPVEVGVFAAGSGAKVLDPWGHYYIYCRWENAIGTSNAIMVISAGPNGKIESTCGSTTAGGDDLFVVWTTAVAQNHAAVWQTITTGTTVTGTQFGATGSQIYIDTAGDVTIPGTLAVTGATTLGTAGLTVNGPTSFTDGVTGTTGTFSGEISGGSLNVTGASTLNSLSAGSSTLSSLSVTNNATVGGTLNITGNTTLTGLTAGSSTLSSLSVTGTTYLGGITSTGAAVQVGTSVAASGTSAPLFTVGKAVSNVYPFTVDQYGAVTGGAFTGTTFTGNLVGNQSNGSVSASTIAASGATTLSGTLGVSGVTTLSAQLNGTSAVFTGSVQAASFVGSMTIGGGGVTLSGVVPIANGGTGQTSASAALAALGVTSGGFLNTALLTSNLIPGADIVNNSVTSTQLNTTGVTAGTYTSVTVSADGRVTAGSNGTITTMSDGSGDSISVGTTGGILFDVGSSVVGNWTTPGLMVGSSKAALDKLDVYGSTAIGTGYAGVTAAPTNGLIVQGNVGISTNNPLGFALDVNGGINATSFTGSGAGLTGIGTSAISGTMGPGSGGTGTNVTFTQGSVVFAGASGVYSQDNANFFWDDTHDRLGIGTNSPGDVLTLGGTGTDVAIQLTNMNASPSQWAIDAVSGGNLSVFDKRSTGNLILSSASSGAIELNSAGGNVGIGTTAPSQTLQVVGAGGNQSVVALGYGINNNGASLYLLGRNNAPNFDVSNSLNVAGFEIGRSTTNGGSTFTTPDFVINTSGNVGIGTATPGSLLSVNGNAAFGSYGGNGTAPPSNGMIVSGNVGIGTNNPLAYALDVVGNANVTGTLSAATFSGSGSGLTGISMSSLTGILPIANGGTNIASQTTNGVNYFNGTSITSGSAFVYTGGFLGVGTSAPLGTLQVGTGINGTVIGTAPYGTVGSLQTLYGTSLLGLNLIGNGSGSYVANGDGAHNGGAAVFGDVAGDLQFATVTSIGSSAQSVTAASLVNDVKMVVQAGGNVGIGTPLPSYLLDTESTANNLFQVVGIGTGYGGSLLARVYSQRTVTGTDGLFQAGSAYAPNALYVQDSGKVGIGTASPQSMMHVFGGEVQVGSSSLSCAAANAGAIRYASGTLYYCDNANTWETLDSSGAAGSGTGDWEEVTQAAPNPTGTSQGYFGASATYGAMLSGDGSVSDVTLFDHSGSPALEIPTGTINLYAIGNVGIGTANPLTTLDVYGNGAALQLFTTGNNTYSASSANAADIVTGSSNFGGTRHDSSIMMWSSGSAGRILEHSGTGGDTFYFSPWNQDALTGANVFLGAATSAPSYFGGNVGIGTTSPSAKLAFGTSAGFNGIHLYNDGSYQSGFGITSNTLNMYTGGSTIAFGHSVPNGASSMTADMSIVNGAVGIGTAVPTAALDVNGGENLRGASVGLNFLTGTGNIGYEYFDSNLAFAQNGVGTRLYINSSGNVGIGTTTPISQLTVGSTGSMDGGNVSIGLSSDTNAGLDIGRNGTATPQELLLGVNQASTYSEIQAYEHAVGYNSLILNRQGGSVGIGTAVPAATLQVGNGFSSTVLAVAPYGTVGTSMTMYGTSLVGLNLAGNSTGSYVANGDGAHNGGAAVVGDVGGNLWFATVPTTGAAAQTLTAANVVNDIRMEINSAGLVGIGTALPQSKLHIQAGEVQVGSSGVSCAAANAGAIRYNGGTLYYCDNAGTWESIDSSGGNDTGDSYEGSYYIATGMASPSASQGLFGGSSTLGGVFTGSGSTSDATLENKSGAAALEVLSGTTNLYAPGNVGIGTATPGEILDVEGSGVHNGIKVKNSGGNYLELFDDGNAHLEGNGSSNFWINGDVNQVLDLSHGGGATYINDNGGNVILVTGGGYVGIGTTSPQRTLEVNAAGALRLDNAGNGIEFLQASSTNWELNANVGTNTSFSVMNGSVGIGTTSPGNLLEVYNGDAQVYNAGNEARVRFTNTQTNGRDYWLISGGSGSGCCANGGFGIWDNTASATRFLINSSGYVGIGTTAAGATLAVNGGLTVGTYGGNGTAATSGEIAASGPIYSGTTGGDWSINWQGEMRKDQNATTYFGINNATSGAAAANELSMIGGTGNSYYDMVLADNAGSPTVTSLVGSAVLNAYWQFPDYIFKNAAGSSTWMVINSSGNVGIGTATPDHLFEVNGVSHLGNDVYLTRTDSFATASLVVDNSVTTGIALQKQGGGTIGNIDLNASTVYVPSGSVGIGTTSPGATLTVGNNVFEVTSAGAVTDTGETVNGTASATLFSGSGASLTSLNASNLSGGTVATARLGSGTASATTFLAGNQTWAVPVPTFSGLTNTDFCTASGTTGIVCSTGSTGTGSVVLSASPTLTGTITAAAANFSGAISDAGETISGGNLAFTAANPSITSGSSYIVIPYGIYASGGTSYFQTNTNFRGGITNDTGAYLTINGGTSNYTYINGSVGIGTTVPLTRLDNYGTGNASVATAVPYWNVTATQSANVDSELNYDTISAASGQTREALGLDYMYITPGAALSQSFYVRSSQAQIAASNSYTVSGSVIGFQGISNNWGTGNVGSLAGTEGISYNEGATTVGSQYSGYFLGGNASASGVVTTQYGVAVTYTNVGTVTNGYGLYISGYGTGGTWTNKAYDVYAADTGAYNYFAGDVGIGTTLPLALAGIYGSPGNGSGSNPALLVTNPTAACSGCTFYGGEFISSGNAGGYASTNVGIYASASGASGANYAAIFANGNVGIGVTTPSTALQVSGTVTATTFTGAVGVGDLNSGSGASSSTFWRGDGTWAAATPTLSGLTSSDFCTASGTTAILCSTGSTGTGSVVLAASPTLTGTVTGAASNWSSTFNQYSGFGYLGNVNSTALPTGNSPSGTPGLAASWNQSGGSGEVDLWNTYYSAGSGATAFIFKQMLTSTTASTVMTISGAGSVTIPGNATVSGNIYLGTESVWLSTWLNQSVASGSSPNFYNPYIGYLGNNMSVFFNQALLTTSSPTFANLTLTGTFSPASITTGTIIGTGSSSTYGAITIQGTKGGWGGIDFNSGGGNMATLMVSGDTVGFYNAAVSGWDWYWTGGTLTAGTVPAANVSAGTFGAGSYTMTGNLTVGGTLTSSTYYQTTGAYMYPGCDGTTGCVANQNTYFLYDNSGNSGLRTNGNFLVNGNIYFGTEGIWLNGWLNQSVASGSSPNFYNPYIGYLGNNMSVFFNQAVLTTSSPTFANLTLSSNLTVGGTGAFSGLGAIIGNGVSQGFYDDGGNIALRTPTSGTIYFQSNAGSATWGTWNSTQLTVSTPLIVNSSVGIGTAPIEQFDVRTSSTAHIGFLNWSGYGALGAWNDGFTTWENLVLAPAGNVGIGMAPTYNLDVAGITRAGGGLLTGTFQQAYGGYVYPGRNDGSGANYQGSWYLASNGSYGLYTNTGMYFAAGITVGSGQLATNGDVYHSWAGVWDSQWVNQAVTSGSSPNFYNPYIGYMGTNLSNYVNQAVLTTSSPSFAAETINGTLNITGANVLYFGSYGGGWYMQDATWIRSYNSKYVYMSQGFDTASPSGVGCDGGLGGGYTFQVCGSFHVGGDAYSNNYYHNSDLRLKTNIEPIAGLDIVEKINGVTFNWKKDGTPSAGVIAQDVEKVMPEAVSLAKDGMKAVSYDALIAPMIEAIKELKAMLVALGAKFDATAAKVRGHDDRIVKLEADNDNLRAALKASNDNLAADEARLKTIEDKLATTLQGKGAARPLR